jgi:hypothetical protein
MRWSRRKGVVVHLAAGDDWNFRVKQCGEGAQDARLGLAAQSEEDEVVTREQRVHDLRHHGFFVAEYTVEELPALAEPGEEVPADFVLYGRRFSVFGRIIGASQRSKGVRQCKGLLQLSNSS